MIKIQLLSGAVLEVIHGKVSAFLIDEGGYDNLPDKLYKVMVDGNWFVVKNEEEFNRVKSIASYVGEE